MWMSSSATSKSAGRPKTVKRAGVILSDGAELLNDAKVLAPPAHGHVDIKFENNNFWYYVADPGFHGVDTFTLTHSDPKKAYVRFTVAVTVP